VNLVVFVRVYLFCRKNLVVEVTLDALKEAVPWSGHGAKILDPLLLHVNDAEAPMGVSKVNWYEHHVKIEYVSAGGADTGRQRVCNLHPSRPSADAVIVIWPILMNFSMRVHLVHEERIEEVASSLNSTLLKKT